MVVKTIASQTLEGLQEHLGEEITILVGNAANFAGSFERFVALRISDFCQDDSGRLGLGKTNAYWHSRILKNRTRCAHFNRSGMFPLCSQVMHRNGNQFLVGR